MTLTGWILVAVVGLSLFGFAMFEIGKRQHKEQPSHTDRYPNDQADKANQQDTGNGAEHEKENAYGLTRILKAVNDYSGALLAAFTALLAVVTALLWCATRDLVQGSERIGDRQVREMKKSADAATKAAKAAEASVTLARNNAHLDQRAWLTLTDLTGFPIVDKVFQIRFDVRNTGKTFAKNVKITPVVEPKDGLDVPDFPKRIQEIKDGREIRRDEGTTMSTGLAAPGAYFPVNLFGSREPIPQADIENLRAKRKRVFVYAEVTYVDIFDCTHWTTAAWVLEQTKGEDWMWSVYETYNDAGDGECSPN